MATTSRLVRFARMVAVAGAVSLPRRSMPGRRRLAEVLPLLLVVSVAGGADQLRAQPAPDQAREDTRLYHEVMSPFCPGLTLADCPSPAAFELRKTIATRLSQGETREAIVSELVATYGPQILADPSDTPIGRVVWGVPIAVSLLAALGLAAFLRRSARAHVAEGVTLPPSGTLAGRLDEELAALD
jgi:cytochrome c-type biogenesis protein CcmH/NrfF